MPLKASLGAPYGWRARVGMITPSPGHENNAYEFYLIAPEGVTVCMTSLSGHGFDAGAIFRRVDSNGGGGGGDGKPESRCHRASGCAAHGDSGLGLSQQAGIRSGQAYKHSFCYRYWGLHWGEAGPRHTARGDDYSIR